MAHHHHHQNLLQSNLFPLMVMTADSLKPSAPVVLPLTPLAPPPTSQLPPLCSTDYSASFLQQTQASNSIASMMMMNAFSTTTSCSQPQPPPRKRQKLDLTRCDSPSCCAASNNTIIHTPPLPTTTTTTPTMQQQQQQRRKKKKKKKGVVQIHPTVTYHEAPAEHEAVLLQHKHDLWYTQQDFTMTLLTMRKAIKKAQRLARHGGGDSSSSSLDALATALPVYGECLASTYLACSSVDDDATATASSSSSVCTTTTTSATLPTGITPLHLEQLATSNCCRGMETAALPDLAAERSRKRRQVIANTVQVYKVVKPAGAGADECVRSMSLSWTAPSRKFAACMGLSDTLSALQTYAQEEDGKRPTLAMQRRMPPLQRQSAAAQGA